MVMQLISAWRAKRQQRINEKFKDAIDKYSIKDIIELLQYPVDVNLQNENGRTALMVAVSEGEIEIVKELIAAKADLNLQDYYKWTALMKAVINGKVEIVKELITANADLNLQNNVGRTALMIAAEKGYLGIVQELIAAKADLNLQDEKGQTALMRAVDSGEVEIVKELIAAKADLNLQDKNGRTALMIAAEKGYLGIVQELIAAKANLNLQNKKGCTALMMAVKEVYREIVIKLIAAGADVNMQDINGYTALIYGAKDNASELVKKLIAAKANLNFQDKDGNTALMHAAKGCLESTQELIVAKANLNLQNKEGYTALMIAAKKGYKDIVRELIAAGADVSVQDQKGRTVAQLMSKFLNNDTRKLILTKVNKTVDFEKFLEMSTKKEKSVSEQIKYYVKYGRTFMLHGDAGTGKTERIYEIDPNLTSIQLSNGMLPEIVLGRDVFPVIDSHESPNEYMISASWVAPSWYQQICEKAKAEPEKNHILFIDEVTNVRPTIQSLIFQLVLKREVSPGRGKLPDNVVIVLAGNDKSESSAAYKMPAPLYRRIYGHIYLEDNIMEWLEWGSRINKKHPERMNVHPLVAGFIATQGYSVFRTEYNEDEEDLPDTQNKKQFPMDPRGWTQVSDIIYDNEGELETELLKNKMGLDLLSSFMTYAKNPILTLREVLDGKYTKESIPVSMDGKLALVCGLRWVENKDYQKVRDFVQKEVGGEYVPFFDTLWSENDEDRLVGMYVKEQERKAEKTLVTSQKKRVNPTKFTHSRSC